MLFTIVTSFYNIEKSFIEKLAESVLNQTYKNWEWVITDDFSTKYDCRENVKKLLTLDKRIRYIEQKEKKEFFWNPNKYANGDIVVNIDCDDYFYPKYLEVYHRMFLKYGEVIFMTCESFCESGDSYIGNTYGNYSKHKSVIGGLDNRGLYNDFLPLPHGRAWRNVNVNFTEGINYNYKTIVNDYLIFAKLEETGKYLHIPRNLHHYAYRQDSISRHIDEHNDVSSPDTELKDPVLSRRRNEIESIYRVYEPIFEESIPFHFSNLKSERDSMYISYITNDKISHQKKELLKDLYFDHNLSFDTINKNIDYYYIMMSGDDKIDDFKDYILRTFVHQRKELIISIIGNGTDTKLFDDTKSFLSQNGHGYGWAVWRNKYFHIKL